MRSRLPEFNAEVFANDDIIIYMLCETNLNETIHSPEVFPPKFNVYRCDRSDDTESKQRVTKKNGGGVLIAVDKSINAQLIGTGEHHGAEQVWVKIKLQNRDIILVEIYIRPDSPITVYENNMQALREIAMKLKPEDILLVSGDFNLSRLNWISDDTEDPEIAIPINASWKKETVVVDTCHELGLFQINKHSNSHNRMLDLIWTNDTETITCDISDYHFLKRELHHPSFELRIHDTLNRTKEENIEFKDFVNADYCAINESLNNVDWNSLLSGIDLNVCINNFYEVINSVITTNVESKTKKPNNHPKWLHRDLISMKNKVNKLHRIMKSTETTVDRLKYTTQRSEYKKSARNAYKCYKLEMEQLINEDPKKFFEYVNTCRKTHDDLPSEMEYNGKSVNTQLNIANSFAKHFSKAYTSPSDAVINIHTEDGLILRDLCANFPTIKITEDLILEKINNLPSNLVSGPDGVPNLFVKKCIATLLTPITRILSETLKTGYVPDVWKKSFIRPVHKSGVRSKVENYRGVALQCVFPKLLDSIIANHLDFHMKSIIDENQHGFVKGKSTITNLAEFTSCVLNMMENQIQTDTIYLDIAKAFDSVSVELLIHKLDIMGLNKQILNWIESYLHGRQQMVKLNGITSDPIAVTSGTGQGYPIGATLFKLFIIDLPRHINDSKLQSFADDTRSWKHINCYNDCVMLQADLDRLVDFFNRNQLRMNASKSKILTYHRGGLKFDFNYKINGIEIERVNVVKDLGVILDERLTFNAHIEYMTAKATSRLAWIKRFGKEFEDPWTIKRLYSTFVLPIVEYGSQIWNPYTVEKIGRIESIQKQFLLFALRKMDWPRNRRDNRDFHLPSYKNRLLLLQMTSLEDRRKVAQIAFIHDIIRGDISSEFILSQINIRVLIRNVRNSEFLIIPIRRHNYSKFEPINYMLTTYNQYFNLKVPNCDKFLIDFNISTDTVRKRLFEYFKNYIHF